MTIASSTATLGTLVCLCLQLTGSGLVEAAVAESRSESELTALSSPRIRMELGGEMGRRVKVTVEQWLLPAVKANPAMLEMFRLRDRNPPYENPVPWAGEFIGKHLICAVQLQRMIESGALDVSVTETFDALMDTQADDGYLGPFAKKERLLGQWDLWGHYHVLLALTKRYHDTGDRRPLEVAQRAADLICRTYLDSGRRVFDAGSHEMNMSVIHVLAILYRETGKEEYLRLVHQIEKEWEIPGAGDYYRMAKKKIEFFETPKPRWESLHGLQAFHELYLISRDAGYRDALLHYWHSILNTDVHNNGSFSTEEGAVGNPFKPGPIETCCTVAWMALSVDALKLARDSRIADQLERATWNAVLAYQHPSGRWCSYNTPMNGKREASAHSIVFQSRPGTPELNCCSVNGPRGIGMISEWAVLTDKDGVYLNYYGPGKTRFATPDGSKWTVEQDTEYPAAGRIGFRITVDEPTETTVRLRIPEWSRRTRISINGESMSDVPSGRYLTLQRTWKSGDTIDLRLDMSLHHLAGDDHVDRRVSLYSGPLLLAYDQKHNALDPHEIPTLDGHRLEFEEVELPRRGVTPLKLLKFRGEDGRELVLCDFASAGASGTFYQSWLPVKDLALGPFYLQNPGKDRVYPVRKLKLSWGSVGPEAVYDLILARDPALEQVVIKKEGLDHPSFDLEPGLAPKNISLYWDVTARQGEQRQKSANGPWKFETNASFRPQFKTSFESDEPQPTWNDTAIIKMNVGEARCRVEDGTGLDGSRALVISGNDLPRERSHVYFKVFDVKIKITPEMILRYKIRPGNELGRRAGLDMLFADGTTLRDSGARDQHRRPLHPVVPRGEVGEWTPIECHLGKWLHGQTIETILLAYDNYPTSGEFRIAVDDIEIRGLNSTERAKQLRELDLQRNRTRGPVVVERWPSVEEFTASGRKIGDRNGPADLPVRTDIQRAVELSLSSLNHHFNWDCCRPAPLNVLEPPDGVPMAEGLFPELYWGSHGAADGTGEFGPTCRPHPLGIGVSHVVGRNLWASLLAEETLGIPMPTESFVILRRHCEDMYDNEDHLGSYYKLVDGFQRGVISHDMREGFLALLALARVRGDAWAREKAGRMLVTLEKITDDEGHLSNDLAANHGMAGRVLGMGNDATTSGRLVGPLVEFYRLTRDPRALKLAGLYAGGTLETAFTREGRFAPVTTSSGHIHSITSSLCGITKYAIFTDKRELLDACIRIMNTGIPEYVSSWGWADEVTPEHEANEISRGEINQTGDVIRTALLLGGAGYARFYEMAERYLRGMLLPAQYHEEDLRQFMTEKDAPRGDYEKDMIRRVTGGYCMHLPNDRTQKGGWPLTTQDIISGAVHALCECWRHRVTGNDSSIKVNLLFSCETEDVTVVSRLPLEGRLAFRVKTAKSLLIRIPEWVEHESLAIRVHGVKRPVVLEGRYVRISELHAGDEGEILFDVPVRVERERVDGTDYTTTWIGNQIVDIQPRGPISPLPF